MGRNCTGAKAQPEQEDAVFDMDVLQTPQPSRGKLKTPARKRKTITSSTTDLNAISESDLIKTAQTGDLLLFKTNKTTSKVVRTMTRSDYDHVAMIVKVPLDPK